jgi:hypothetical protein
VTSLQRIHTPFYVRATSDRGELGRVGSLLVRTATTDKAKVNLDD